MDKNETFIGVVDEVIAEEMQIMQELIQEEIVPLLKYKSDIDAKVISQKINEMYKLEAEAVGKIEKEKALNWLKR